MSRELHDQITAVAIALVVTLARRSWTRTAARPASTSSRPALVCIAERLDAQTLGRVARRRALATVKLQRGVASAPRSGLRLPAARGARAARAPPRRSRTHPGPRSPRTASRCATLCLLQRRQDHRRLRRQRRHRGGRTPLRCARTPPGRSTPRAGGGRARPSRASSGRRRAASTRTGPAAACCATRRTPSGSSSSAAFASPATATTRPGSWGRSATRPSAGSGGGGGRRDALGKRPTARFHHAMLVASLPSPITGALEQQLLVLGGDDKGWPIGTIGSSQSRTCGCSPSLHGTKTDSGRRASSSD